MKNLCVALAATLAVSHAQAPPRRVVLHPPAAASVSGPLISQGMLANLEKNFDMRLAAMDVTDPLDVWGSTRGLYLEGYGVVFTTELSLIVTPGLLGLLPKIPEDAKLKIHQRKVAHVQRLEDVMKDLMNVSARTLVPLPDDQKIAYAVRVRYLQWEDSSGLPAQILMTADKKSAISLDVKMKVE